ncbi:mast cell protease 3-like [Cololabis saira]|uniref:mast cell protease 3-like n=1 Tax=Cololabis saira TaxID=129043 RepID=UPI002AD2BC22|nr:mast cell protease 3-like [Cololabis saira]
MVLSFLLVVLFAITGTDGSHIVGGRDAAPHSRPYMASLQIGGRHFCGGVLVKEDFVLTAAHCAVSQPFRVVLGIDTLRGNAETKQQFRVLRSIPHPEYNDLENDVMLLKLSGEAQLTKAVQVIPLKSNRTKSGSQCITAGWGDIGDNRTLANRLQEVNVTILTQRMCRRRWGSATISRSMVCGVGAKRLQGFCSGDSGGPLVCDGAAAGVVSFSGRRCGNPRTPDVYMRVSSYMEWIRRVINSS